MSSTHRQRTGSRAVLPSTLTRLSADLILDQTDPGSSDTGWKPATARPRVIARSRLSRGDVVAVVSLRGFVRWPFSSRVVYRYSYAVLRDRTEEETGSTNSGYRTPASNGTNYDATSIATVDDADPCSRVNRYRQSEVRFVTARGFSPNGELVKRCHRRPGIGRDHPPNLSISLSGGKETKRDSPSNGERKGKSQASNPRSQRAEGNVTFRSRSSPLRYRALSPEVRWNAAVRRRVKGP